MIGNDNPKATSAATIAVRSAGTSCEAVASLAVASGVVCGAAVMSNLLHLGPAEDAGRHEDQGDGENHERRHILVVGGVVGRPEHLDETDQKAAEDGAGQRANTAKHGGR